MSCRKPELYITHTHTQRKIILF